MNEMVTLTNEELMMVDGGKLSHWLVGVTLGLVGVASAATGVGMPIAAGAAAAAADIIAAGAVAGAASGN